MPAFNAPQAKHDLTWYWQARGQLIGFFWGRRHLCAGETSGYIKAEDHEIHQSQPRLARIIGQFIAVVIARVCIVVSAERLGSDKTEPSEFGCGDRI